MTACWHSQARVCFEGRRTIVSNFLAVAVLFVSVMGPGESSNCLGTRGRLPCAVPIEA